MGLSNIPFKFVHNIWYFLKTEQHVFILPVINVRLLQAWSIFTGRLIVLSCSLIVIWYLDLLFSISNYFFFFPFPRSCASAIPRQGSLCVWTTACTHFWPARKTPCTTEVMWSLSTWTTTARVWRMFQTILLSDDCSGHNKKHVWIWMCAPVLLTGSPGVVNMLSGYSNLHCDALWGNVYSFTSKGCHTSWQFWHLKKCIDPYSPNWDVWILVTGFLNFVFCFKFISEKM